MARVAESLEFSVGTRSVRVSNPDKPYFADLGVTKRQIVEYFLAVGEGILGALRERPTTLERWPGGVVEGAKIAARAEHRGDAFYQKRVPKGAPDYVETARITFPSGRYADEVCPTELAVVAWAANLGTLTFHPWPVRRANVDHPDQLRIDLDPQPGTDFDDAVRVAYEVRELLDGYGMAAFPKTSGGRGVHLYVPIEPRWTFTEVRRALIALGREVERRLPDQVTVNWWKEERGARVFIDYNQMARDRTIASAYSVRPTPRALVSAPVTWDELGRVRPEDFSVLTMPARFAEVGDLHAGVDRQRFSLQPLIDLADRDADQGDLPYPPDYPKMPGEPKRVQPSKARDDT
ncbi:DNA polymerase domain-containing protein [Actinokineospora sp.]|uniref:DNA polymerase domain-containing protein n=1 Tax=Actinokineospora sp. TaxID=1872133 RepID=UPI0040384442